MKILLEKGDNIKSLWIEYDDVKKLSSFKMTIKVYMDKGYTLKLLRSDIINSDYELVTHNGFKDAFDKLKEKLWGDSMFDRFFKNFKESLDPDAQLYLELKEND